jgi:hypothetical protein
MRRIRIRRRISAYHELVRNITAQRGRHTP